MIDIGKILKRAWQVLWNYKILWIFAFLLALTAGGSGGGNSGSGYRFNGNSDNNNNSNNYNPNYQPGTWERQFNDWADLNLEPLFDSPQAAIRTGIWVGVGIIGLVLVVGVITAFVRYPTETAIIRMVDDYEQTGTKVRFKDGWKLGWNKRAFRVWLIDFIIGLPAFLVLLVLLGAGVLFFVSIVNGARTAAIAGSVAAIGCAVVFFMAFAILMVFLNLLRQFFVRAAALEETTVGESFRRGWAMFKANWKSAALVWLVMLGIGIGFGIVGTIAFILLVPAYIVMAIPAAIVSVVPAAIGYGITSIFASEIWPWVVAVIAAIPFFFTIMFSPASFVQGLYMLFTSNVWTLTYREMKAMETLAPVTPADGLPPLAE